MFHSEILDLDHDVGFLIGKSGQQRRIWLECQAGSYFVEQEQVLESVGIWFASRGVERILPLWDSLFYTESIAACFIPAKLAHWGRFG